jgi:hypothetical protein
MKKMKIQSKKVKYKKVVDKLQALIEAEQSFSASPKE